MLYCTCSNRVEILAEALKKALWQPGSDPLKEHWVILPSTAMKRYLMMNLVDDFDVAMGLKFPYLDKAIKLLVPLPTMGKLELSLFIENEVEKRMELGELKELLGEMHINKETLCQTGVRRALAQFADVLANLFMAYGLYAEKLTEDCLGKKLTSWQEDIFRAIFSDPGKAFPYRVLKGAKKRSIDIHIFCPSFVPKVWLKLFSHFDAKLYALSPSAHPGTDGSLLLASSGRSEKQFSLFLEELKALEARVFQVPAALLNSDFATEDVLPVDEPPTLLRALQSDMVLQPEKKDFKVDDTVEIHSYSSKFAEVEGLYVRLEELVQKRGIALQDIVIMAPQISDYTPYIEAVFGHAKSSLPVQFFDTKGPSSSLALQGFLDLLLLADSRFDAPSIVKLLYNPHLKSKFSKFECDHLLRMMQEAGLLWGIDEIDRKQWIESHYGKSSGRRSC